MHCMPPNVSTPIAWPWIVRIHCYLHNHCYLCQDRGVSIHPCTNSRIISCFPCDFGHCILFSLHILGSDRYVYNSPFSWWRCCALQGRPIGGRRCPSDPLPEQWTGPLMHLQMAHQWGYQARRCCTASKYEENKSEKRKALMKIKCLTSKYEFKMS